LAKEIRLFLLGSVIGALLHQKGIFVLHGSSVAKNNQATIFTGVSSAGKSSIAFAMYKKGYSFVSDDLSVFEIADDTCSIQPGIPQFKVWKDVLDHLNYIKILDKVRPEIEKYSIPISSSVEKSAVEIRNIISISTKNTPGIRLEELFGASKFSLLRRHTYRLQYLLDMKQSLSHFHNLSVLSAKLRVFKLERPRTPLNINEIATFIEREIIPQ